MRWMVGWGALVLAGCPGDADVDTEVTDTGEPVPWEIASVDDFWAPSPGEPMRSGIYDRLWEELRDAYAGFGPSGVDWEAVHDEYAPRVAQAEGHGRWYQLLSEHAAMLRDGHTYVYSVEVCNTPLSERPPVYWHDDERGGMGVCVTPLEDDTLLVYRAAEDNPAELSVGDRLVGYDSVPWRRWLERIDAAALPWCGFYASAPTAADHQRMISLVDNPHLFDTLDVIPAGETQPVSVDTGHFLGGYYDDTVCTEQLDVDGVAFPFDTWDGYYAADSGISWGVVEGDIGLIYAYGWTAAEIGPFADAVRGVVEAGVRGIVLDHRFNTGGGTGAAFDGLDLLFDTSVERIMNCAARDPSSDDLTALYLNPYGWHAIDPDPDTAFDGPIAVLTGPKSVSAGDLLPYYLSFYPNVRRFGRPTAGSFGAISSFWAPDPFIDDLYVAYTYAICVDAEEDYLQGADVWPEEVVWLEPEGVSAGRDAVLEAAMAWIEGYSG